MVVGVRRVSSTDEDGLVRYVVRACEAAKSDDPELAQRLVYISVRVVLVAYTTCVQRDDPRRSTQTQPRSHSTQGKSLFPRLLAPCLSRTHPRYTRSKGLTELALARLGYADTIVLRPALLRGADRAEPRLAEWALGYVGRLIRVLVHCVER